MTRILIVEDEQHVRRNVVEILEMEGYEVLEAADGEEGVRIARSGQPDLILCDIRMPRLDGFGVLARLSHDRLTETIPFIFITARTERSDQRMGMGLGADDYITKPFTRKDLLASIRKRLEKQQNLARRAEEKFKQMQENITRSLPQNLLSPLSVLLANSEMLADSDTLTADPSQVRAIARGMRRAAARLAYLVQSYLLYLELDATQAAPARREALQNERLRLDSAEIRELLRGAAREYGRAEDLDLEMGQAELRMAEPVFYTLMEALVDLACTRSSAGRPVKITGRPLGYAYEVAVTSIAGSDPAAVLLAQKNETPFGLTLARRIVEIYGGNLEVKDSLDGVNEVRVSIPRVVPI